MPLREKHKSIRYGSRETARVFLPLQAWEHKYAGCLNIQKESSWAVSPLVFHPKGPRPQREQPAMGSACAANPTNTENPMNPP